MIHIRTKQVLASLFFICLLQNAWSQNYTVARKNRVFFGVYGGVNFTMPHATKSYAVMPNLGESDVNSEKTYGKLNAHFSSQFGFNVVYGMSKQFSLLVQPGFYNHKFEYRTQYAWMDTVDLMHVNKEMKHIQRLSYFTIPLLVRWDMLDAPFSPYIQLGVFADFRYKASKSIYMDGIIDEEVDHKDAHIHTATVDLKEHINKFNVGAVGGIGFSYFTKYFVLGMECNFRMGFLPIVNDRNRFSDFTGFTAQYLDVLDQLKLNNINAQIYVNVPLNSMKYLNILRRTKY